MAEPGNEEGNMELVSRPPATNPVDVVSPLPASGGATACDGEEEGSDESAAGMSKDNSVVNDMGLFGPSVSQTRGTNDATILKIYPEPETEEKCSPYISEEILAKAMNKLSNVVPKRYKSTQVPTIYKVPDGLKGGVGNNKYYRPVSVYLGCFLRTRHERRHYNKLEEYKWCCVRHLIDQLDSGNDKDVLLSCMESMNRLLPKVLASYSQDIKVVNNDEMAEQMLLDGCFILRHLLMYSPSTAKTRRKKYHYDWNHTMGHCYWIKHSIARDMMLLENQIPFCVVKELFELLKIENESEKLLFTGGVELFRFLGLQMHDLEDRECNNVHHLLHLFYLSVGFPHLHERRKSLPNSTQWVPSAKELEEAGVHFRKRRKPTSFLDIHFDYRHGILEIPRLELYDTSNVLFRNLIAFEQTYPKTMCDISAYTDFMDCLVNTPEDMRILNLRGILVNHMNSEQDASRFFSQLCERVFLQPNNYLAGLMQDISKYKDSRRHKWRAALVRNYFRNPWMMMSVFAGMLLLALTFLQTVFTIYPYYKPSQRG